MYPASVTPSWLEDGKCFNTSLLIRMVFASRDWFHFTVNVLASLYSCYDLNHHYYGGLLSNSYQCGNLWSIVSEVVINLLLKFFPFGSLLFSKWNYLHWAPLPPTLYVVLCSCSTALWSEHVHHIMILGTHVFLFVFILLCPESVR